MIVLQKPVPIGFEDFKRIIDENMYYVDKSIMIKKLIDNKGCVNLFTRPRCFGNTLNLSMIRRFFEEELNENGQKIQNAYLFDGLEIAAWQGVHGTAGKISGDQFVIESCYAADI